VLDNPEQGTRAPDNSDAPPLSLTVASFTTAFPKGPAYGNLIDTTWPAFAKSLHLRREGDKDGVNFVPARFTPEPDGRVRRLKETVRTRTAIVMDCETDKRTGEVPPAIAIVAARVRAQGWAGVVYSSHNHTVEAPRYRIVIPLSAEIPAGLPAVEVVADRLGLGGVLDRSKVGASSLFYLPSTAPGQAAQHETIEQVGDPADAEWLRREATAILEALQADHARQHQEAAEAAAQRREARAAQGFDTSASVIDAVRARLDLDAELLNHGYQAAGRRRYLFPGSTTGIPGVYTMAGRDGVERVYSHHAADPLAAANLPSTFRSKAIDVVDVLTVLDFAGDQKKALSTLAIRFGIWSERKPTPPPPPSPETEAEPASNVVRLKRSDPNEDWKAGWHRSETGSALPTLYNVMLALRRFPGFAAMVSYDEMQLSTILNTQIPGHKPDPTLPRHIRDKDTIAVQEAIQDIGLRRIGKATVQDGIDLIASENGFHPVRDYLNGLVWDGTTRCRGWLGKYLGVEGTTYSDEIGKLFLIALVARIFQPGCQADYVLVLEGPQGAMKSTACRVLAGKWFSDSLPDLTHADPVRLSMHLRGKWLIEIAELASFNASETEIIKAFATRTHETYTPKYGHNEVTEPRQCLLIASTNQSSYLHDETGARRFWPVTVTDIDIPGLRAARDQLFAEAVHLYRAGAKWWPDRDFEQTHVVPEQAARFEEDAWEGVIQEWLGDPARLADAFTITAIAQGALRMEAQKIGTREQRRIRKVLIQLGWKQQPGRTNGRLWDRPQGTHRHA